MKHKEGKFSGGDGRQLYRQSWMPDDEPKAVLVIIHGLGEHSGRYANVVNHLAPLGYAIHSFDHRGHGRSAEKPTAHVHHWGEYHQDVGAFLEMVRQQHPDLPLFLMGHSMGGLITLGYVLDHPEGLQGVVASGPAVGAVNAPPILMFIGRILSRIAPGFVLQASLNGEDVSRDQEAAKAYEEDPLVTGRVSARWSTEFVSAIEQAQSRAAEFKPPLLIVHGEDDPLVPEESSRIFFEKVQHQDKERIVYEGGRHEPHNDIQHAQVTADIHRWLEAHL